MQSSATLLPAPSPAPRTVKLRTRIVAPDPYLGADGLHACLAYLQEFSRAAARHFPAPPPADFTDPTPAFLLVGSQHGPITSTKLDRRGGHEMVGISIHGRNLRWLHPLDYVAVRLIAGFGVPLTLQKTGKGYDYPRFRAHMPGVEGRNIYLIRALADAKPWQIVTHLDPIAGLNAEVRQFDHHFLGRDALGLRSVQKLWDEGKQSRVPVLGRRELIEAALFYQALHGSKADFNPPAGVYRAMIAAAFMLADWRHGRPDGKPVAADAFDSVVSALCQGN